MRVLILSAVLLAASVAGCSRPYTYISYEVVRVIGELAPGDDVRMVRLDGTESRGEVVRVDAPTLSFVTANGSQVTVSWEEIRVIERVRRASVSVD